MPFKHKIKLGNGTNFEKFKVGGGTSFGEIKVDDGTSFEKPSGRLAFNFQEVGVL